MFLDTYTLLPINKYNPKNSFRKNLEQSLSVKYKICN